MRLFRFARSRPLDQIPEHDLVSGKVWEFDLENESKPGHDETWVYPVKKLPVDDLGNRVVVVPISLANGDRFTGMIGNIELTSLRKTNEFICLSVCRNGEWFHLSRYFDVDYPRNGPAALARFAGLSVEEVFPVSYDLSGVAVGLDEVINGAIPAESVERLTEEERMSLIIGR